LCRVQWDALAKVQFQSLKVLLATSTEDTPPPAAPKEGSASLARARKSVISALDTVSDVHETKGLTKFLRMFQRVCTYLEWKNRSLVDQMSKLAEPLRTACEMNSLENGSLDCPENSAAQKTVDTVFSTLRTSLKSMVFSNRYAVDMRGMLEMDEVSGSVDLGGSARYTR
ncbi:hypothetical protein CYMTET_51322, partial [Cymbomonas tetramitiformis]